MNTTAFYLDDTLEDDDDKLATSIVAVASHFLDREHLTKQERLAVECLKPRLQVVQPHLVKGVKLE